MAVKRKAEHMQASTNGSRASKKQQLDTTTPDVRSAFRSNLFEKTTFESFRKSYESSGPYPHAVVPELIESNLLRSVRSEITTHIHFTLKETDIYRIHQSGDLANLSKLDKESLKHLPSLVRLRDALYSHEFREWVTDVTGAGKLSGIKTDMAVNVYTPGSYLLCHDDVIGSRRVSYILYLTDPDSPWKAEWGGGLRLYPTEVKKNAAGEDIKVPVAEHSLNIPPSFGQLSFFTVLPGESYHDVEEVYHGASAEEAKGRIRMAISGWYHIPQEGEDGYEEGLEQAQAQKSSLTQLKGAANEFDEPQVKLRHFDEPRSVMNSSATEVETDPGDKSDQEDDILTEQDLTFLLQYIRAQYLTPDMIQQVSSSFAALTYLQMKRIPVESCQVSSSFEDMSMLQLEQFLNDRFAEEIRAYLQSIEKNEDTEKTTDHPSSWKIARPPHKHRFAYLQEEDGRIEGHSPVSRLLVDLMHSHAFKKWLALVTGIKTKGLTKQYAIARRFRRGKDYALASGHQGNWPQLEFTISLTPSTGWEHEEAETNGKSNSHAPKENEVQVDTSGQMEYGGEEVYMAGDDDDESVHSKSLPQVGKKADPAVYKAADDEEDGILFANMPSFNQFSAVLRDKGTLRFVKYISEAAKGDRWDIKGEVELAEDAFDEEESIPDSLTMRQEEFEVLGAIEEGESYNDEDEDEDEDEEEDDDDHEES